MASILLVDDDLDILKIGSEVLATADHFVFTAKDAVEALDHLNSKHIDLIVTDANMPRYSGFDLIQTLKNHNKLRNIPVAFLTGRREKKGIEHAVRLGAVDYIVKPIDPLLFIQKINGLLTSYQVDEIKKMDFYQSPVHFKASMAIETEILSISELGLEVVSYFKCDVGQKIHIESKLFDEIGMPVPLMKALFCQKFEGTDKFKLRIQFLGVTEKTLTKIRAWIVQTTGQKAS